MSILVHDDCETGLCRIDINRPQSANALDVATLLALNDALALAGGDTAVSAIVIGACGGKHFCAGADMREPRSPQRAADFRQGLGDLLSMLFAIEKPVVAAIDGAASGAGAMVACAVDRVFIADSAFLCFPELDAAVPPLLAFDLLAQSVGVSLARELVLTGRRIYPEECVSLGLVAEQHPPLKVRASAEQAALDLAAKPGDAFVRFKRHLAGRAVPIVRAAIAELSA